MKKAITLKGLSKAQQAMLRDLVVVIGTVNDPELVGYSQADLVKQFGVTPRTVSALRAHVTMGSY